MNVKTYIDLYCSIYMPTIHEEYAIVIDKTLPSPDILTSHGRAGEPPSLR